MRDSQPRDPRAILDKEHMRRDQLAAGVDVRDPEGWKKKIAEAGGMNELLEQVLAGKPDGLKFFADMAGSGVSVRVQAIGDDFKRGEIRLASGVGEESLDSGISIGQTELPENLSSHKKFPRPSKSHGDTRHLVSVELTPGLSLEALYGNQDRMPEHHVQKIVS